MPRRRSYLRALIAIVCALIAVLCFAAWRSSDEKKVWQAGTIVETKAHQAGVDSDGSPRKYDVSIKVEKRIYVELYIPEKGQLEPEFHVGKSGTVLVEGNTLKYNDLLGRTYSVRILSTKDAPAADSK